MDTDQQETSYIILKETPRIKEFVDTADFYLKTAHTVSVTMDKLEWEKYDLEKALLEKKRNALPWYKRIFFTKSAREPYRYEYEWYTGIQYTRFIHQRYQPLAEDALLSAQRIINNGIGEELVYSPKVYLFFEGVQLYMDAVDRAKERVKELQAKVENT